jgi:hypothetical protein
MSRWRFARRETEVSVSPCPLSLSQPVTFPIPGKTIPAWSHMLPIVSLPRQLGLCAHEEWAHDVCRTGRNRFERSLLCLLPSNDHYHQQQQPCPPNKSTFPQPSSILERLFPSSGSAPTPSTLPSPSSVPSRFVSSLLSPPFSDNTYGVDSPFMDGWYRPAIDTSTELPSTVSVALSSSLLAGIKMLNHLLTVCRLVDNEEIVGKGIKDSGIDRSELFIVTKGSSSMYICSSAAVEKRGKLTPPLGARLFDRGV